MRLIDADALNLEYEVDMADDWKTAHEMANIVKYAPTVDAVPVIRCKDCKWFAHCDDCYGDCMKEGAVNGFVYTNDYCSRAEHKPPQVNPKMVKALLDRIEKQRGEE